VAVDGGLLGPPGWVISAFEYAVGRADRNSTVTAQIRAAREAGYTGTRPQLIAIGQGLISADAFRLGQGGGPGSDRNPRVGPPPVVANPVLPSIPGLPVSTTPPLIPAPSIPPGTPGSIPPRPPPSIPGIPSGPSIPDKLPGIPAAGTLARSVIASVLRGGWAGLLFYPREAGRGSALCVETRYGPYCPPVVQAVPAAVPVPSRGPRRRGRRLPGTVAPPRRRDRGRVAQPAAPAVPRGRPVTISRPLVVPEARVVSRSPPVPRSLPPPGTTFPPPQNVSLPAPIPATRPAALPAIAQYVIPAALLGVLSQTGAAARAGSQTQIRPATPRPAFPSPAIPGTLPVTLSPAVPGLGSITLPGIGPSPNPLTNPATLPLTALNPAVAQSPAQDLDRQCRERAKRKRKKREPRSVCYRGTFTETKRSTRKMRKEKIPCR
jgi:hypothetical protein